MLGSVNWLMIGLLQYDFIAGIFGFQASIFSRLVYITFGVAAAYLVIRIIVNKGSVKIWEKRKKKEQQQPAPAYANVEAAQEPAMEEKKPKKKFSFKNLFKRKKKNKEENTQNETEQTILPPMENLENEEENKQSLFDEYTNNQH